MKLSRVELLLIICISLASIVSASAAEFQQVEIKGPKNATEQYSGVTYGPIDSDDTLWRIANRYRQNRNLSLYQVMVAIYELNPDAFEDNNLNLIKNGYTLMLPSERYIARIDVKLATQKAQQDDASWQPKGNKDKPGSSLTNLKPPQKLVSKDDLSQSTQELEKKLGALDEEQTRQFQAIRQQFAESIEHIQSLLNDNQKLYANLDNVNQQIEDLQQQEGANQQQTTQILDIQNEILTMIRQREELDQKAKMAAEKNWLSNEMLLIGGSVLFWLVVLIGFAVWFIKRKGNKPAANEAQAEFKAPPMEQTTELDDLSEALTNELSEELDDELSDDGLFGDEDLLDDVLSDELGESLDEALDEELDDFDDLNEEMLVPDVATAEAETEVEEGSAELDQDELDSLFDEDDDLLAELDGDMDAIELSEDEEEALPEPPEQGDIDESAEAAPSEKIKPDAVPEDDDEEAEVIVSVADQEEKPEISIDELLNAQEHQPSVSESLGVDDSETISEEMLQQLDKEIASQNEELDKATEDLLNELEQVEMMQGMMPDEDEDEQSESAETESQHSIQQLDNISDEVIEELDETDIEAVLNDPLLAEMGISDEPDEAASEAEISDFDETDSEPEALQQSAGEDVVEADSQDGSGIEQELTVDELLEQQSPIEKEQQTEDAEEIEEIEAVEDLETPDNIEDVEEVTDVEVVEDIEDTDEIADVEEVHDVEDFEESVEVDELEEDSTDVDDQKEFDEEPVDELEQALQEFEATDSDEPVQVDAEAVVANDAVQELSDEQESELDESGQEVSTTDSLDDEFPPLTEEAAPEEAQANLTGESSAFVDSLPSLDDIGSLEDFDDSELDQALDSFSEEDFAETDEEEKPARAKSTPSSALDDVPGLGDWLSGDELAEEDDLEELENTSFDELLESIAEEKSDENNEAINLLESADLDLDALLSEDEDIDDSQLVPQEIDAEDDFLDVETLLSESDDAEEDSFKDKDLALKVSLDDFPGLADDDDLIDVDDDQGVGAKMDLARAYIEIEDIESAKELLQEVIENGDAEQQQEAQQILDGLSDLS